jgi:osmoprotectant transport system ATP-binding protein
MIHLDHVTKTYPGTTAVKDLTLEVAAGDFCVLIGPSGCGKSTTLRMINRLIEASSGTISIGGSDVRDYRPEDLRRKIGYAIQSVGLFPHMTVAQNISVVPQLLKWERKRAEDRVDELLALFDLAPAAYRGKYPRELSGGEAQRVGVARALAADPAILLMDEPFGALDPVTRESLQNEFARIQRALKKTIVFVTHDIDEAIRLATKIAIIKDGELVQYDTPEAILSGPQNQFVLQFIGADRALKRLSRIRVGDFARPARSISVDEPLEAAVNHLREVSYVWVTDSPGNVVGWLDQACLADPKETVAATMVPIDSRSFPVPLDATLRDALARMIWEGTRSLAAVDEDRRLAGEISLSDLLDA